MNWLSYLMRALTSLPLIIQGIEAIHGDTKSGAEKKQLALEALGLAGSVAANIDPAHAQITAVVTQVVGQTIDGVVAVANASKEMPVVPKPPVSPSK